MLDHKVRTISKQKKVKQKSLFRMVNTRPKFFLKGYNICLFKVYSFRFLRCKVVNKPIISKK